MNSKLFRMMLCIFLSCIACKENSYRLSFTLKFSISPSNLLSVGDTLILTSSYSDKETDYHSGFTIHIPAMHFDTEIIVLQLGEYEDESNCRIFAEAVQMEAQTGAIQDQVVQFEHLVSTYELLLRIIPKEPGIFALRLSDTEEIRKVFNGNYNRHLLNVFNIYELKLGSKRIPIDERLVFFKVE
jgi:hypothetical protein